MQHRTVLRALVVAAAVVLSGTAAGVRAQAADTRPTMTWDLQVSRGELDAGLPDAHAVNLRGALPLSNGDLLQIELLGERKFGADGVVAAGSYTHVLSDDWYIVQTLAVGEGGPNWAIARADTQLSRKWLSQRQLVSSAAVYGAVYDNDRSDRGLRFALAWYLPAPAVLEAGVTLNLSQPGNVFSHMPFASVTLGREGQRYLSLRVARGTEAYQALGVQGQLVDFRSHSVALGWRQWLGPRWGLTAQAEHYRNPSYRRRTLGLGLFLQF